MRFLAAFAIVLFAGCTSHRCKCDEPPDIRIVTTHGDQSVSFAEGDRVELAPLTAGCSKNVTLSLRNLGRRTTSIRISTTRSEVEVMSAPQLLRPGENGDVELRFTPADAPETTLELLLNVDVLEQGHRSEFLLAASVVSGSC